MRPLEQEIWDFMVARGWERVKPSNIAKSIVIEGAELLEIFQWSNQELEEVRADEAKMARVKQELADVFIYAHNMALQLGLDVDEIIRAKLAHANEKYPAEVVKAWAHTSGEPGTEEAYLKIKEEYRKEK